MNLVISRVNEVTSFDFFWEKLDPLLERYVLYFSVLDNRKLAPGWKQRMKAQMRVPQHKTMLFVAQIADKVYDDWLTVGFLECCIEDRPPDWYSEGLTRAGWVSHLFVLPQSRKQGVGERLALAAEEWLREEGATVVDLFVHVRNGRGYQFWENHGYAPSDRMLTKQL